MRANPNGLDYSIDPTGKFKDAPLRHLAEAMGFIPGWLKDKPPGMKCAEWFGTVYAHGGGWSPMEGWGLTEDGVLTYPHDPATHPYAVFHVGSETVYIYPHAWVCIKQEDGSFEVSRMD